MYVPSSIGGSRKCVRLSSAFVLHCTQTSAAIPAAFGSVAIDTWVKVRILDILEDS